MDCKFNTWCYSEEITDEKMCAGVLSGEKGTCTVRICIILLSLLLSS